ncbi:MAG: hypothetical protein JWQ58_665 [Reyranella sp.]|nr:hypothetical protein [Reyranella sp.]
MSAGKTAMSAVLLMGLAGCAGRAPAPVAVVQAQDRFMDCSAISAEVQANNKRITELGQEEGGKVAQNVIVGAAGLIIPILWFGMDFQNAAGKEVSALQSRQQYLATMAEQRCGSTVPVPIQMIPAASSVPAGATPVAAPVAPVPAPAPAVVPAAAPGPVAREMDCIEPDGSKSRVVATACPPPSTPAP